MTLISLSVEARGLSRTATLATADRNRLLRAREMLLADLTAAPSLVELASSVGVSVPTLTRGFQLHFGKRPSILFQQERMHLARHRLAQGDGTATATAIAADLGYTNASHFSAAFKRQFGISPKQVRSRQQSFSPGATGSARQAQHTMSQEQDRSHDLDV